MQTPARPNEWPFQTDATPRTEQPRSGWPYPDRSTPEESGNHNPVEQQLAAEKNDHDKHVTQALDTQVHHSAAVREEVSRQMR